MSPRTRFSSVGYAYASVRADTATRAEDAAHAESATQASMADFASTAAHADSSDYSDAAAHAATAVHADTADYAHAGPGVADDDWLEIDSVLYTGNFLGIARGDAGNVLYGDSAHTHINFGVGSVTGESGQDRIYCGVYGGDSNTASHHYATVVGGF